jgi:hypothetical protein
MATLFDEAPLVVRDDGRVFRPLRAVNGRKLLIEENGSEVIVGLLSASIRLLHHVTTRSGQARTGKRNVARNARVDKVARGLDAAAKGLEGLRACGSDTTAEDITGMLRKLAAWIRDRDRAAIEAEFTRRYRPQGRQGRKGAPTRH